MSCRTIRSGLIFNFFLFKKNFLGLPSSQSLILPVANLTIRRSFVPNNSNISTNVLLPLALPLTVKLPGQPNPSALVRGPRRRPLIGQVETSLKHLLPAPTRFTATVRRGAGCAVSAPASRRKENTVLTQQKITCRELPRWVTTLGRSTFNVLLGTNAS